MTKHFVPGGEKQTKRLLVIDSNRSMLDYYQLIFQAKGYRVDITTFAETNQPEIERVLPDLILFDLLADPEQERQTWRLARQLQARAPTASTPLLICTAAFILPTVALFVQESGIPVLFKPFEVKKLTGTVFSLLFPVHEKNACNPSFQRRGEV